MNIFDSLKEKLIVSCQAEGDSPFNNANSIAKFAIAAVQNGAAGIRSEGIEKTKAVIQSVDVPVIGLLKSYFEDGSVKITGSLEGVIRLIDIGCHIIAIDGTSRLREGLSGADFIKKIKDKIDVNIMADISTFDEGLACAEAGSDCISTTLSGYTPYTKQFNDGKPDFKLIEILSRELTIPVFAEGRINTPEMAAEAIKRGAWSVVVGSAITRPGLITSWFADSLKQAKNL